MNKPFDCTLLFAFENCSNSDALKFLYHFFKGRCQEKNVLKIEINVYEKKINNIWGKKRLKQLFTLLYHEASYHKF